MGVWVRRNMIQNMLGVLREVKLIVIISGSQLARHFWRVADSSKTVLLVLCPDSSCPFPKRISLWISLWMPRWLARPLFRLTFKPSNSSLFPEPMSWRKTERHPAEKTLLIPGQRSSGMPPAPAQASPRSPASQQPPLPKWCVGRK